MSILYAIAILVWKNFLYYRNRRSYMTTTITLIQPHDQTTVITALDTVLSAPLSKGKVTGTKNFWITFHKRRMPAVYKEFDLMEKERSRPTRS